MLELLVYLEVDAEDLPENFRLMQVEIAENACQQAYEPTLPNDWHDQKT